MKNVLRSCNLPIRAGWFVGCLALASLAISSCTSTAEQPEFNPDRWAPRATETEWDAAGSGQRVSVDVDSTVGPFRMSSRPTPAGAEYDLPALIDLALRQNPETRGSWEAARGAAAGWSIKRAPFYPLVGVSSDSGYERSVDLVPKHWGTLKNWQSVDQFTLEYVLVDFGRRDAAAESAREQLIAANFRFNREIQNTVFAVEKSFYLLDAERAGLKAANAIVALAETDRRAVEKRHALGLATKPDLLLAQQRESQAQYQLQDAELEVSNAQADLAVAVGLRVDSMPPVQNVGAVNIPATLSESVEDLINDAIRERPDLAASVSSFRAREANAALARADMYPVLSFASDYGIHAFNYRLSNPTTPQYTAMAPEYAAMLTLRWDVFAGMEHLNTIYQADDDRESERAHVRALEIDVAGQVWRAYYAFQTAVRRYHYAEALLAASQSAYDSNLRSYNRGLATIVDLLAADRYLADAKYTTIQSRAQVLISAVAVAYSVGTISPSSK